MTQIIFIAAGMGSRLAPYTDDCPKCMLPLNGRPVIKNNINCFLPSNDFQINIVVGYKKNKIIISNTRKFENTNYKNNNILFSLMYASTVFEECIEQQRDLIISYSDIIYSKSIVDKLVSNTSDIVVATDMDWQKAYQGRTEHPISEAERVYLNKKGIAIKLGKNLEENENLDSGEFIGLLKLSPAGASAWLENFNTINKSLKANDPFQGSNEFQKAYLTHFLQYLISQGLEINCSKFEGGWMEFDTSQDYEKLLENYG